MYKKRKLNSNRIRKRIPLEKDEDLKLERKTKSDSPEQNENNDISGLEAAKNLKILQTLRLKNKGINVEHLGDTSKEKEADEYDKKLLDKQFTKNVTEKEIEEAHIESFINERMKEFYKQEEVEVEKEKKQNEEPKDLMEELYKMSEDIKVKSTINDTSEKLNCVTGLTEVPLPAKIKLKNIEETEKIKRKFLREAMLMKKRKNTN